MRVGDAEKTGDRVDYEHLSSAEALKALNVDPAHGLGENEARARLSKYGENQVPEKKMNPGIRFGRKFWGLTAWMLELTMVFSYLPGNYFDVYIIAGLLMVNASIGFVQEEKASAAVDALRQRLQVIARVLRDGQWQAISAKQLVPGDIVRVRAGDFVPADLKIIEKSNLSVDQSALTGESLPVERGQEELLYSGAVVKRGETNAVVVATGAGTYFGKTTELLQSARPRLHMEEITSSVVRSLLLLVGILVGLVLVASYAKGTNLLQVIPLALVLIVFAVPVALPAMFTVSMALGSRELARKGVLVTRLSASEDAASMDILCADKTGTITANRLKVTEVLAADGFDEDRVVAYGALASREANQDPIDLAFISAAREKNLLDGSSVQEQFVPFDPSTRRTEALISSKSGEFRVMKGAVDVVSQACGQYSLDAHTQEKMGDLAARGYRTLAVAMAGPDQDFRLCGLVALYDAPRPDSKKLIDSLKELGVSVKMLTGDALAIAREVSTQIGLGDSIVRTSELRRQLEEEALSAVEVAVKSNGFAEVYPEDKYLIVKSLQASGHITGMTGDGVNDAPALRQAEVGIAVSNATDVAKSAASAVLTDQGLSNIVSLVEVGRMIYQRIVTWVLNKIVKTFEVAVFIATAFLLTGYYTVSALDIVLLLFLVDFVTISLSTDNVVWSKNPERWKVSALVKTGVTLGVITLIELFGLLFIGFTYLGLSGDVAGLQTFMFIALFYLGMFTLLILRERRFFWNSHPSRTLALAVTLDMAVAAALVTIGIPGMKPIPVTYLAIVFSYVTAVSLALNDRAKYHLLRRFGISV